MRMMIRSRELLVNTFQHRPALLPGLVGILQGALGTLLVCHDYYDLPHSVPHALSAYLPHILQRHIISTMLSFNISLSLDIGP